MTHEHAASDRLPDATPIATVVARLYDLRTWRAFDIDDAGRVLAGWDDLGSVQLVEIDTDGSRHPLTSLPGACSGRYVPGRREVIVQHDAGGDENMQLSRLDLTAYPPAPVGLEPATPPPEKAPEQPLGPPRKGWWQRRLGGE